MNKHNLVAVIGCYLMGADVFADPQTINFPAIPPQLVTAQVDFTATASSSLPVSYRIVSGPGWITNGTRLVFSAPGVVLVAAEQAGDVTWLPASAQTNRIEVFALTPHSGPASGGNIIALSGPINGTTNIMIGTSTAAIHSVTNQHVSFIIPPDLAPGLKDVVVHHEGGVSVLTNAYLVNPHGQIGYDDLDWSNWSEVAGLPMPINFSTASIFQDRIIVIGGVGFGQTTNVFSYDGTNWTEIVGLPIPLNQIAVAVQDGYLFVLGGMTDSISTNVYRFDGTNWVEDIGLPHPRYAHAGISFNSDIYILGGDEPGGDGAILRREGNAWIESGHLPNPNMYQAVAALDDQLFVIGGFDGGSIHANTYAITTDQVREIDSPPFVTFYPAAATFRDAIYLVGGSDLSVRPTDVYSFDGVAWHEQPRLPAWRWGLASVVYKGSLYALGGSGECDTCTNVYKYPATRFNSMITPNQGSRHGGDIISISGSNLGNGTDITNVTLCGAPVQSIISQSPTQVVVLSSGNLLGSGDVCVYSTSYGASTAPQAFTYSATDAILTVIAQAAPGASPVYYTNLIGSLVTNAAPTPVTHGSTQYLCTGWTLTGQTPTQGVGSTIIMTAQADATLYWHWKTQYWVHVAANELFYFNNMSRWYDAGGTTDLVAGVYNYFQFQGWTINGELTTNPLVVTVNGPISIDARYSPQMVTNTIVPLWWVDQYDLLNDPEQQVQLDQDNDGVASWNEFVAGTDPTNGQSQFLTRGELLISDTPEPSPGLAKQINSKSPSVQLRFHWLSEIYRRYDLEKMILTNNADWQSIPGFTDLPATPPQNEVILTLDPQAMEPGAFFRARVRLE